MTDQTATPPAEEPVDVAAVAGPDGAGVIAVQGNYAVLVASFADMDTAKAAYYALLDAEAKRAIDIEGVLVANADYQGKIHIQKMTDHTTRKGAKWGMIAGAVIGVLFPPSIIGSAIAVGIFGAAAGKVGAEKHKAEVAKELADVLTPGTSGIVALVAITAVDLVKKEIPQAKAVETVPVDDETADAVRSAAAAAGDSAAATDAPAS